MRAWLLVLALGVLGLPAARAQPPRVQWQRDLDFSDRTGKVHHKTNWCDVEQQVRNGTLALKDSLRGKALNLFIPLSSFWARVDEEAGGMLKGHHTTLLDELALRAGLSWRNTYVTAPQGTLSTGETFTELAQYYAAHWELIIDVYADSSARRALGLDFPFNFLNLSPVLITRVRAESESFRETFLSFTRPFSLWMWLTLIATTILSALVFWALERGVNFVHFPNGGDAYGLGTALYYTWAKVTWSGHYSPVSGPGRIFASSWAVVALCFFASYTARIASSLVSEQQLLQGLSSMEEADSTGARICVWKGTFAERAVQQFGGVKVVLASSNAEQYSFLRAGLCDGLLQADSVWELDKNQKELNPDCELESVDRSFLTLAGGWVMQADYEGGACTGLLRAALTLHLAEMEELGIVSSAWNDLAMKESTVSCGDDSEGGTAGGGEGHCPDLLCHGRPHHMPRHYLSRHPRLRLPAEDVAPEA